MNVVLSCEHGGNHVPAAYRDVLAPARRMLDTHRGLDVGALDLARDLARALSVPLIACTTTRLLVDTNRSARHRAVFSEWTRTLDPGARERLLDRHWRPHRRAVEDAVRAATPAGATVVHISVHSFTPRLNGRARPVDVGLLYDPSRRPERAFCDRWIRALAGRTPALRLRRNQPYRGTADGLTTHLRSLFRSERYIGIELEVSQRFPRGSPARWRRLRDDIVATVCEITACDRAQSRSSTRCLVRNARTRLR